MCFDLLLSEHAFPSSWFSAASLHIPMPAYLELKVNTFGNNWVGSLVKLQTDPSFYK